MTENFKKIFVDKGVLNPDDLSAAQKQSLYDLMESYGASRSFTYDRFFKEGFEQWELTGVNAIKKEFANVQNLPFDPTDVTPGAFYKMLGEQRGLKATLREVMKAAGMKSEVTIIARFTTDNWKPFELMGVRTIIEEFCRGQEKENTR